MDLSQPSGMAAACGGQSNRWRHTVLKANKGQPDALSIAALPDGATPKQVLSRLKLAGGLMRGGGSFVRSAGGMDKLDSPGMHLTLLSLEELIAQVAGRLGLWPELKQGAEPDPGQPVHLPCALWGEPAKCLRQAWTQLEAAEACLLNCWRHLAKVEFNYRRKAHEEIARMDLSVSTALGRPT